MSRRIAFLVAVLLVTGACAPAVSLSPSNEARLAALPEIPVYWVRADPPWVDCATQEGEKTWEFPGSARDDSHPGARSPLLASAGTSLPVLRVGGVWESIEAQWTEPLRVPPVDPAASTASRLVARARDTGVPLAFGAPRELAHGQLRALGSKPGASPVLVVEAPRFVLVGCFFTYQPWFDARATLVRPDTGEVLWRDVCGGTYPGGSWPPVSTRDELLAYGSALYARVIDERAAQCADELVGKLMPGRSR